MFDRKSYYKQNKEKQLAYAKQWRQENPEKFREQKKRSRKSQLENNYAGVLVTSAKTRAKKKDITFTITKDDIVIPDTCPILGITLCRNEGLHKDNSPSIDRIIPELGYVPGNVRIISWRANRIKCDATPTELMLIAEYFNGPLAEED